MIESNSEVAIYNIVNMVVLSMHVFIPVLANKHEQPYIVACTLYVVIDRLCHNRKLPITDYSCNNLPDTDTDSIMTS